ncbi:MAG: hypothetical protein ACLSUW_01075 [Akkermansia sp.]
MLKTIVIFIIALLDFGMIRLPLESYSGTGEGGGLLDNPVELSSSDYLEQQLAMVSWRAPLPGGGRAEHGSFRLFPDFRLGQPGTPLQPGYLSRSSLRFLLGQRIVAFGQ